MITWYHGDPQPTENCLKEILKFKLDVRIKLNKRILILIHKF